VLAHDFAFRLVFPLLITQAYQGAARDANSRQRKIP
jgi:hypothetical protein